VYEFQGGCQEITCHLELKKYGAPTLLTLSGKRTSWRIYRLAEVGAPLASKICKKMRMDQYCKIIK
jgi:hypothetical protein